VEEPQLAAGCGDLEDVLEEPADVELDEPDEPEESLEDDEDPDDESLDDADESLDDEELSAAAGLRLSLR